MPRNNNRGGRSASKNNNPTGRNQYSDWGVMEMARERPMAAAAATVGAAAAGLFLWSKRAQISEQLSNLSEQVNDWRSGQSEMFQSSSDDTGGMTTGGNQNMSSSSSSSRSNRSSTASGRSRQQPAIG